MWVDQETEIYQHEVSPLIAQRSRQWGFTQLDLLETPGAGKEMDTAEKC